MDENDKIRQNIKDIRNNKGMSWAAVSEKSGISYGGLMKFLGGHQPNASVSFLSKICAALDVQLADLLSGPPAPPRIDAPESEEMARLMRDLTADERKKALDIVRALKYGYTGNKKAS